MWEGFKEMQDARRLLARHGFTVELNVGIPCDEVCEARNHVPGTWVGGGVPGPSWHLSSGTAEAAGSVALVIEVP